MIRIKGTIGDMPVDLVVEGLDSGVAQVAQQVSALAKVEPAETAEAAAETTKPSSSKKPTAVQMALRLLQQEGQQSASQIINYLNALGFADQEIKRTLMALRHAEEVVTKRNSEHSELDYRWQTPLKKNAASSD